MTPSSSAFVEGRRRARVPPDVLTERLVLREWRLEDFPAFESMYADAAAMRYLGGPLDSTEAWCRMAMHAGHWALHGYGKWVVERRADQRVLGRVGLWNPGGWPDLEMTAALARHAWGQGYASEAFSAAIEWTWEFLDAPRLISLVRVGNEASARMVRRAGMRFLGRQPWHGEELDLFEIRRPSALHPGHGSPSRAR